MLDLVSISQIYKINNWNSFSHQESIYFHSCFTKPPEDKHFFVRSHPVALPYLLQLCTLLYLQKSLTRPLRMEMNFGNNYKKLQTRNRNTNCSFSNSIANSYHRCKCFLLYNPTYSSSVIRKKEQGLHRDYDLSKNDKKKRNQYT